jgi:tetratricopeptide (TPR) repeat protein
MTSLHFVSVVVLAAALPVSQAAAEPENPRDAREVAERVDASVAQMKLDYQRAAQSAEVTFGSAGDRMDRRLSEAEVQAVLGDHLRASVLLLDVVEDPRLSAHPRRDEAIFRLAEALRHSFNDRAAWNYYEGLAPRSRGDRLDAIVEGMLLIVSRTRRFEDIDRVLAYMPSGSTQGRPAADYAYGRALFQSRDRDPAALGRSLEVFRRISTASDVSARARYHAGATLVLMGRYPEASAEFTRVVDDATASARLHDLARLSVGRLQQELGATDAAVAAYDAIEPSSPYFSQMLYELAWTHVAVARAAPDPEAQREAYERALQATELLMATVPGPTLFPEARILQGNLQIRLGAPETAYQTFESIIDRYAPAREELTAFKVRQADTKTFFEQLVASELEGVDAPTVLPDVALDYAREQDGLTRVVRVERDLSTSEVSLEESREMVKVLTAALSGEQRYRMFVGLRGPRDQMISIRSRALARDLELLEWERGLVFDALSPAQRAEADVAHARVLDLAGEIRELPTSAAQVQGRRRDIGSLYEQTSLRAYKLTYRISGMRAQLVAVESWLSRNRTELSAAERERGAAAGRAQPRCGPAARGRPRPDPRRAPRAASRRRGAGDHRPAEPPAIGIRRGSRRRARRAPAGSRLRLRRRRWGSSAASISSGSSSRPSGRTSPVWRVGSRVRSAAG